MMSIDDVVTSLILNATKATNSKALKIVDRIVINGEKFYSAQYTRMKRCDCSVVMLKTKQIGQNKCFILSDGVMYSLVEILSHKQDDDDINCGLLSVAQSGENAVVKVTDLVETVIYMECVKGFAYVKRLANQHGYSIFK